MLPSSMRAEMLPEVPSTNPFARSFLAAAQICSGAFSMKVAMAGLLTARLWGDPLAHWSPRSYSAGGLP